jgi:hypothetical protein
MVERVERVISVLEAEFAKQQDILKASGAFEFVNSLNAQTPTTQLCWIDLSVDQQVHEHLDRLQRSLDDLHEATRSGKKCPLWTACFDDLSLHAGRFREEIQHLHRPHELLMRSQRPILIICGDGVMGFEVDHPCTRRQFAKAMFNVMQQVVRDEVPDTWNLCLSGLTKFTQFIFELHLCYK